MSVFEQLGKSAPQNPAEAIQRIRANPASFLRQAGITVPEGMTNPQQMVHHILNSGQIPQPLRQQAMQMMARMGLR